MIRKQRISDEEKQRITQKALEKELQTLIRQYFVLDHACQHSQFSRDSTLEKGDRVLTIFAKEHANILKDLGRAAAPGRIKEDEKYFIKLTQLLEENTSFKEKVFKCKVYFQELDGEVKAVQKDVQILRKQQVTDRQYEQRVKNASTTLEALENRLETQMIQFGTICTANKQLRADIAALLSQRNIFMSQWGRLIEKLTEGKKIMLDLIEQATVAYNQREEWCTKLRILREKARCDLNTNMQEMREQRRRIDNNFKLKEFFWIKGQKRLMRDLEKKEQEKREVIQTHIKEKLEVYEDMLGEIKTFCKEDNIKLLANTFTKQEEINLSNFIFITEMIRQCEEVNDRLGFLHLDIDERQALHESRKFQQDNRLLTLESDLQNATAEADEAEAFLDQTTKTLNTLLSGVSELFRICKCDQDPLLSLLGDNKNVQFYNVDLYLKILESMVHRVMVTVCNKDKTKKASTKKVISTVPEIPHIYNIDSVVKVTPCSLCVEHEMVSDVIDTLQLCWSKSEALSKLETRLSLPGGKARLHTISHCHLPKARGLMQRRYE